MGASLKRNRIDLQPEYPSGSFNHPYTFPPDDGGDYFTTYFHLGTRKFDATKPDTFLFGDLQDINYLTHVPSAFPYKQPLKKKPIECLTSYINIHKETVKLTRLENGSDSFKIEFLYDSEFPCKFSFFYHLPDVTTMDTFMTSTTYCPNGMVRGPQLYRSGEGLEQKFSESSLTISPSEWETEKLTYDIENGQRCYPVVILMEATNTEDGRYQSLMTICNIDETENNYSLKVLKQKLYVEGMEYILHEVFGLENKAHPKEDGEEDEEDSEEEDLDELGAECVVCYTDVKDTILLPCRHFCLCSSCAGDLRYQASNCPICRAPFQAIVQIQGLQEIKDVEIDDDEITNNPQIYGIPGYKSMSILQAINGYPKLKLVSNSSSPTVVVEEPEEERGIEVIGNGDTVINMEPENNELVVEVSVDEVLPTAKSKDLTTPPIPDTPTNTDEGVVNGPVVVTASIESASRSSSVSEYSRTSRDSLIRRSQRLNDSDTTVSDIVGSSWTASTSVDSMTSLINEN